MTNQSTDSKPGRFRRYSVSHLLELAPQPRVVKFDLSKFTYDAARAGVVPPLGACVMSTRRALSDRARNWSQGSSSSQDEFIIYRGSRIVKEPERQPSVPPAEERAQQDAGFARFLRKHSSPTHQRVTAGGRIVPMEQRPRPPTFSLQHSKHNVDAEHKDNAAEGTILDLPTPKLDMSSEVKPKLEAGGKHILQPQPQMPANPHTMTAGINVNLGVTADAFAIDSTAAQSHFFPAFMPAPLFHGMYCDPFGMAATPIFSNGAMPLPAPLTAFAGPMSATFSMPLVSSPEVPYPPALCAPPAIQKEIKTPEDFLSFQKSREAEDRFEELGQQLKLLDRHRAMGARDPHLGGQRMTIVQLRSDTKLEMAYWKEMLENDMKMLAQRPGCRPASTLNVKAAAYVPLKADATPVPSSDTAFKVTNNEWQAVKSKVSPKAGPRRIPIVAPPKALAAPNKRYPDQAAPHPEVVELDGWGERVGDAPEELARQQNELLAQILQEQGISPQASGSDSTGLTSEASSKSSSLDREPAKLVADRDDERDMKHQEWMPTNPGRAPPHIEAMYEVQLDAMRLPIGFIAKVRMPDGTIDEIEGCGLRRPASFEMDPFERRYWTEKPVLTEEITSKFIEVRACGDGALVNRTEDYANRGRRGEESHDTRSRENAPKVWTGNGSGSKDHRNNRGAAGNEMSRGFDMPRRLSRKAYTSMAATSSGSDPSLATFRPCPSSSSQIWSRGDDRMGWSASEHSRNMGDMSYDAVNSKGYTSVSVQNVHAMGRLPHTMDGTTEYQRRSAISMLSAAGKVRSPQLAHGPGVVPDPFDGPDRRNMVGMTTETDDVFRPRVTQQYWM